MEEPSIVEGNQEDLKTNGILINTSWHSYPKIFALGHRAIKEILENEVIVEEKIDGSQFSFGVFEGELKCRSKSVVLNILAPEKMFIPVVEIIKGFHAKGLLTEGYTYRAEYVAKPKHNTLVYNRAPDKLMVGFDVATAHEEYLSYDEKVAEFARLGVATTPAIYRGKVEDMAMFRKLLETAPLLGGPMIEGIVVKNYHRLNPFGQLMVGKFVAEEFKEVHQNSWGDAQPTSSDFCDRLGKSYATPARWLKSVQHLRDEGKLDNSPKDIGMLLKAIHDDIESECREDIRTAIANHFYDDVARKFNYGFPQWYKEQLVKTLFTEEIQ